MPELYRAPDPDLEDRAVIDEINDVRAGLAAVLRAPKRWSGGLRRTAQARAIQGSNTIEGYTVSDQDAAAAVEDERPLTADEETWAEIIGYRRVLTYVLNMATEPGFTIDEMVLRTMHFMLLEHDLSKGPGSYRPGAVYVRDDRAERHVYEGPDPELVPQLMKALSTQLAESQEGEPLVRAAMAHLNLVMIHPFRDGNGRMARALQTMVLAADHVVEPTFSSIEEWLGHNTDDYYQVLAATGQGSWQPGNSAHLWVKFNLRAHHIQAQTMRRRFAEAERLWVSIDAVIAERGLPERTADPLFDALLGLRVTRPTYVRRADLEDRTATRDLGKLVDLGLLEPRGQTRGRYYVGSSELMAIQTEVRASRPAVSDPFPLLGEEIRRAAAAPAPQLAQS